MRSLGQGLVSSGYPHGAPAIQVAVREDADVPRLSEGACVTMCRLSLIHGP